MIYEYWKQWGSTERQSLQGVESFSQSEENTEECYDWMNFELNEKDEHEDDFDKLSCGNSLEAFGMTWRDFF